MRSQFLRKNNYICFLAEQPGPTCIMCSNEEKTKASKRWTRSLFSGNSMLITVIFILAWKHLIALFAHFGAKADAINHETLIFAVLLRLSSDWVCTGTEVNKLREFIFHI